ncbi:MAG: sel1 repeat family protein, partial [Alphaproteobacteria bacterium]|nr:sel1 repeat family protein [Alphaproteobacteria bacterium]
MGLEAEKTSEGASARLIAAGRTLLAQGDTRFSLTRLCAEAGVTLEDFRASFASKAALLQQLMEPAPAERAQPPQADPWLERRLRVFERALSALEEKSEKRDREYRQTILRLEEKLAALSGTQLKQDVAAAAERAAEIQAVSVCEKIAEEVEPAPQAEIAPAPADETASDPEPDPLALAPLEPMGPPARADSEFLEAGRRAALAHARTLEQEPKRRPAPNRLLLISVLVMVTLLFCAMLALGHAGYARAAVSQGTAHRNTPLTPLAILNARADSGDVAAERTLAFAYLRGQGVTKDLTAAARWAQAAAEQGDAEAQYLAGSLYRDGAGVARDNSRAFTWFAKAANAGEVKAMHNLAIAYLEGAGTTKDEAAGAAWFTRAAAAGYLDSAFDLAVLYEKGQGVPQDAHLA